MDTTQPNSKLEKYIKAITAITNEQSKIIGSHMAMELAGTIKGIQMNNGTITLVGDPKQILQDLVDKYSLIFGQISIEVSKTAVKTAAPELDTDDLPQNLK